MADLDSIAVARFQEYLRVKTVQPSPDYAGCMAFLQKMAEDIGLTFETIEMVPGKPIALMSWLGSDQTLPALLLNSHTDVVPVSASHWTKDPFGAEMDSDGRIHARGAQDMKCVGIGYLEAIRRLKATGFRPKRSIFLTFVPDEEIGGYEGMQLFSRTDQFRSLNLGVALDEGIPSPFTDMLIFSQERAPWWIKITADGVAGHGSGLPQGTAIEKLMRVLGRIYKFRDGQIEKLAGKELKIGDVTSVNVTRLEGGVQTNVIPETASITVDVRISPTLGEAGFEAVLKEWTNEPGLQVEFQQKATLEPESDTSGASPYFAALSSGLEEHGFSWDILTFPGATDSRFIRGVGIPAYGISPFNQTPILLHDHDEFLQKDIFLKGVCVYTSIISNLSNC